MEQLKMNMGKKIFKVENIRQKNVKQRIKALILAVLIGFAFHSGVRGQNIGYVYADSILLSVPGYKQSLMKSDSMKNVYSLEIEQSQNNLQAKYKVLLAKYKVSSDENLFNLKQRMSPEDTLNLNMLIQESQLIESRKNGYNEILNMMYTRDIKPTIEKVNALIKDYAEKNKIDVVFVMEAMGASVAYININKNITNQIIARINIK